MARSSGGQGYVQHYSITKRPGEVVLPGTSFPACSQAEEFFPETQAPAACAAARSVAFLRHENRRCRERRHGQPLRMLALREAGHEVVPLHALFIDPPQDGGALPGLRALCGKLGLALHVEDMRAAFRREVVSPFIAEHVRAHTPNPCAQCNRVMKFGSLLDAALRPVCQGGMGADAMATGHYAALEEHPAYGRALRAGKILPRIRAIFSRWFLRSACVAAYFLSRADARRNCAPGWRKEGMPRPFLRKVRKYVLCLMTII